jgi:pimeloyl-ACP methyl ester carboxylesterase
VVAYHLRGRGGSDRDPTGASYVVDVYASDVLALLDSLDLARAHLVGTSLGGMVAQVVAVLAPARVGALVLNDVGPELAPAGLARIRAYAGQPASAARWEDAGRAVQAAIGEVLPGLSDADWVEQAHRMWRDDGTGTLVPDYDPAVTASLHAGDEAAAPPAAWPLFEAVAAGGRPLLLLRGGRSDLLAPSTVAGMRERAPQLVVALVPDRGHAPTLDAPVARAAIEAFLAALPEDGRPPRYDASRPSAAGSSA